MDDIQGLFALLKEAKLQHDKAIKLNKEAQIANMKTQEELLKTEKVLSNAFRAILKELNLPDYFDFNELNK
jgi:hypothetical protein